VYCLRRQETLLAVSKASRGPSIYCTREAVHDTQASHKGKRQTEIRDVSVHHDGYEVHQRGDGDGDGDETRIINMSNRRGDQTPTRANKQTLARLRNLHERQSFRLPQGR
jgi:hypothetical protein